MLSGQWRWRVSWWRSSGIHDATRTVVLERACFQRSLVRRTGQALGLTSEVTARFERGVDAMQTDWAAQRAVSLMIQLTGARHGTPIDASCCRRLHTKSSAVSTACKVWG